jgi:haloacid dehalogenase-like hydrolase
MSSSKRPTVFLDLDGTLVFHNYETGINQDKLLPGTLEALAALRSENYYIVLTTGRTEQQCLSFLNEMEKTHGFKFDRLVFDLPTGIRVLVNDRETDSLQDKAIAINVTRNQGWKWML